MSFLNKSQELSFSVLLDINYPVGTSDPQNKSAIMLSITANLVLMLYSHACSDLLGNTLESLLQQIHLKYIFSWKVFWKYIPSLVVCGLVHFPPQCSMDFLSRGLCDLQPPFYLFQVVELNKVGVRRPGLNSHHLVHMPDSGLSCLLALPQLLPKLLLVQPIF
jgi:hypothetical protein